MRNSFNDLLFLLTSLMLIIYLLCNPKMFLEKYFSLKFYFYENKVYLLLYYFLCIFFIYGIILVLIYFILNKRKPINLVDFNKFIEKTYSFNNMRNIRNNEKFSILEQFNSWFLSLGTFLYNNCLDKHKIQLLIIVTNILPKTVFLIALIADIRFSQHFYCVIKWSFLIVILLLEIYFFFASKIFCLQMHREFDKTLHIIYFIDNRRIWAEEYGLLLYANIFNHQEKSSINLEKIGFLFTNEACKENLVNFWDPKERMDFFVDTYYNKFQLIEIFYLRYSEVRKELLNKADILIYLNYCVIIGYMLIYSL